MSQVATAPHAGPPQNSQIPKSVAQQEFAPTSKLGNRFPRITVVVTTRNLILIMRHLIAVLEICIGLMTAQSATAFVPSILPRCHSVGPTQLSATLSDDGDVQAREAFLEQLSQRGSDQVAKMSIAERAKRAMLAEAIEDNILAKEIQLEELIGENCILPTDPELLQQCKDISLQIMEAQKQYEALVTGGASVLLSSLESLGNDND